MYDTHVTVVGNALHDPEWRRTANTGAPVTTFKIASTSRRLDRASGKWIDGNSLRVRVVCWRNLAVNVARSVTRGDPLIVTGRLYTRDWKDGEVVRTQYELEASAVGHDLTRGRSVFERIRPRTSTSEIDDEAAQQRVGGVLTEPIPPQEAPARFDATPYDVLERELVEEATTVLQEAGLSADAVPDPGADSGAGSGAGADADPGPGAGEEPDAPDNDGVAGEPTPVDPAASDRRRGPRRTRVPA